MLRLSSVFLVFLLCDNGRKGHHSYFITTEFGGHKGAGVESNGVDFIVHWRYHGEDGGEGVVQRICFDYERRAWNPVWVKTFFSVLKAEWNLLEKSQAEPLWVRWVSGTVMLE